MISPITLRALDGSNPLAFLAALGALRLLQLGPGGSSIKMRWKREAHWIPEIFGFAGNEEELCQRVFEAPKAPLDVISMLGKNLTVDGATFARFAGAVADGVSRLDRRAADFACSFANELCEDKKKGRVDYTDFCFITGSGHQHFIGTMEALAAQVTQEHIRDCLFGTWRRDEGYSMRWDPTDAAEYALRWGDPGKEGASAVWGANLLAIEGLPLFPVQPQTGRLQTCGFFRPKGRGLWPQFTWPIWTEWIGVDTLRSLLSLQELRKEDGELDHTLLRERGMVGVYRSQRVRIGKGANFKVSFRPSRAV